MTPMTPVADVVAVKTQPQSREEYVKAKVALAVECCAMAKVEGIPMMYTDYEEKVTQDKSTTKIVVGPTKLNIVAFSTDEPAVIAAITAALASGGAEEASDE